MPDPELPTVTLSAETAAEVRAALQARGVSGQRDALLRRLERGARAGGAVRIRLKPNQVAAIVAALEARPESPSVAAALRAVRSAVGRHIERTPPEPHPDAVLANPRARERATRAHHRTGRPPND
jgi:hypothetical protein